MLLPLLKNIPGIDRLLFLKTVSKWQLIYRRAVYHILGKEKSIIDDLCAL